MSRSIKNVACPRFKNYYFAYERDYNETVRPKEVQVHNKGVTGGTYPANYKEVYCYDIYGRFFKKFESNTATAKYFNTDTSSTCRMIDNSKKKVLHRDGIHLYNLYSKEQTFENKILDRFKEHEKDGDIEVYTLFHEFIGEFSKELISEILGCHLHSLSQAITQKKILKGFYFIRD